MRTENIENSPNTLKVTAIVIVPDNMIVYAPTDFAPTDFVQSEVYADTSYKIYPSEASLQSILPVLTLTGGIMGMNPCTGTYSMSAEKKLSLITSLGSKLPSEVCFNKNWNFELILNEFMPYDL